MSEIDFNEISFRNVVDFYRHELLKIDGGEKASVIFGTRCERVKLLRKNILVLVPCQSGKRLILSEKTRSLLGIEK